jgi:type III restriction enzyme
MAVEKLNLSEHTLDINIRKCRYDKFDFSEIEEYVSELTNGRDYQFDAIKNLLIYLWGGAYLNLKSLAVENYKNKISIQHRFQSEENFLRHLPLPDRISGVVHMATGTGKSYVIFAVAYLSILLGKVKRVLVLGPSSTVIESGLRGKFKEYLFGTTGLHLKEKLPEKYRNIPINLLDENHPIEDNSIVIENINSIYNMDNNAIGDTLFSQTDEVLVLSDEVHHCYSHLKYTSDHFELEEGGNGEVKDERLWMKFIRTEPKIKWHIGFTGTPYNQDEYFTDVIYNYSIKDALDDKIIKKINPIIHTESETEDEPDLTQYQKYEQIIKTHYINKERYSYPDLSGKARLKPITIFINPKQTVAERNTQEFISILAEYFRNNIEEYKELPTSRLTQIASEKVICVISKPTDDDYQVKLDAIEELDPEKTGGKVEFIFAVNKLSEGWDVDNVYQIVPMEDRVFNSKLLISQVLGRGLRLPRNVPYAQVMNRYPEVTITNHEKFAEHIKDLLDAVTECETRFYSKTFKLDEPYERNKYNFNLLNLDYIPSQKIEDSKPQKQDLSNRTLILTKPTETLKIKVDYLLDTKKFSLTRNFYTVDQIVEDIATRFEVRQFENTNFDFGNGVILTSLPTREDIEKVIRSAMKTAGFTDKKLSEDNRKQIDIFFNQFLPRGNKKVVRINIEGNPFGIKTEKMKASSIRASELDKYASIFISEDYQEELKGENLFVIDELNRLANARNAEQIGFQFVDVENTEYYRQCIQFKPVFAVNTSMFKTPQNLVIVNHKPERDFLLRLIDNSKYIDAWIKSRDMDFYSLDYEFFKGGKDRTRRSFNPDYFIKIDISNYIIKLTNENPKTDVSYLLELQDKGKTQIIKSVEIKSDDDKTEVTNAKERWGTSHFESLNKVIDSFNPIDIEEEFRIDLKTYYIFDLLTPEQYGKWFADLRNGRVK